MKLMQLARLHDGALHVAELAGDVLGRADREPLLERGSRLGVLAGPAHLHHRVVRTAPSGQPPDAAPIAACDCGGQRRRARGRQRCRQRRDLRRASSPPPCGPRAAPVSSRRWSSASRSEQSTASRRRSAGRRPRTPRRCRRRGGPSLVRHPRGRLRPARGQSRPRGSRQRSRRRQVPGEVLAESSHNWSTGRTPRRGTVVLGYRE